jgi:hypothetical protein
VDNKFRVTLSRGRWKDPWPDYFDNFYCYCQNVANDNNWNLESVVNRKLKPLGGRLIITSTQGWYLRWNDEKAHTLFVLKWS